MLIISSRQRLRRVSSQESINSHRARRASPVSVPEDPPALPNIPEENHPQITFEVEEEVPDTLIDFTALWTSVLQARPPVEIDD